MILRLSIIKHDFEFCKFEACHYQDETNFSQRLLVLDKDDDGEDDDVEAVFCS